MTTHQVRYDVTNGFIYKLSSKITNSTCLRLFGKRNDRFYQLTINSNQKPQFAIFDGLCKY